MSDRRAWKSRRRVPGLIELRGRLLPVKDETQDTGDGEEDSDGPDNSDPEFLDADEIEGGAIQVKSWKVPSTTVIIKTEDSLEYMVNGHFPLEDPWWTVNVKVRPQHSLNYAKEAPSYELDDDSLKERAILSQFLTKCALPEQFKQDFLDWIPQYHSVSYTTLKELANDFKKEETTDILPYLEKSSFGAFAFLSFNIPMVMKYLPKLLPSKIRYLFMLDVHNQKSTEKLPPDILCDIEAMMVENPWKLGFGLIIYRELHLCGCEATLESFLQCEDLLERIPVLQWNALIIYNELKKKCMEQGDIYVDIPELTKAVTKDMSAEAAWEALQFMKEEEIVVKEQQRIFLYRWYWYEVNIAESIHKIVLRNSGNLDIEERDIFRNNPSQPEQEESTDDQNALCSYIAHCPDTGEGSEEKIKSLQESDCLPLDTDQREAVKMILANPVTVISGKGGCGKTTVVSLVFKSMIKKENDEVEQACKALEDDIDASEEWLCDAVTSSPDQNGSIRFLLTAPTGKAASLLKKKTGLPAATLHQVTCSYSAWKKLDTDNTPWKFSKVEALVVDEASLVSVRMFSAVLNLLYCHGRLEKLVILGDVRQLPSIEPGNMLADVFSALRTLNWSIELKTNHRAESQLIVDNATRISHQCCVEFDACVHFNGHSSSKMPSVDNKFILVHLADDVDLSTAISALLKNGPGLEDDKRSQFIAFRRMDCLLINELCCRHYSNHSIKNQKSKYDFRCGDKVCCTKNAYVKDLRSRTKNSSKESDMESSQLEDRLPLDQAGKEKDDDDRLCNGEIFFVVNDVEKDKIRELTLSDGEDRNYTLNYKALRSRSGLRHAWARTIHTFQGSEEDTVVYVLGTTGRQNWKHVYTAVTRGRQRVYIIAKKDQLDKAITNKARDRKTRLKQRLKDKLPQSRIFTQPTAMPSTHPQRCQAAEEQDPDITWTSQPLPYTQLKSPPHVSCPPMSTTPIAGSSASCSGERHECGNGMRCTTPERVQDSVLEVSPTQKRTGDPVEDSATPTKIKVNNNTDWPEESPTNSRRLNLLSLQSPCPKKLF